MNKIWKINKKAPKSFLNKFPEYSELTLQLLWDRGLKTQKAIDEFFNPDYDEDLHDPFLLKDIKKAIKRIEKAAINKEKVAIFADYDADGICGAVLLTEVLKIFKIKPEVYIPDRNLEGYGLNLNAIKKLGKEGVSLILTIDCGMSDFEEVKLANKLGIDVILIDHHEILNKTPSAFAIINPKQKDCKYPFKYLSATGVAFKLAQAISKEKSWEKWLLDLVAISIVTDSMLLLGENRTLVNYGLVVLSQTKRAGLKALMKKARIDETNLNTYVLGFILGPRINAASRVDHGTIAYKLLIAFDKNQAEKIAQQLEEKNQQRQQLTKKILREARQRALKHYQKKKIIIEGDKNWLTGMAGLIAQRLRDEFWRPCFIYQEIDDFSTGSARTIPGFNLVKALSQCGKFLEDYGGHAEAAGFKVLNKNLNNFQDLLEKIAQKEIKKENLIPYLDIDVEVESDDLDWPIFKEIQKFEPFGSANLNPSFLIKELKVLEIRSVGSNGNHLKLFLEKETKKFKAIGFGLADFCDKIQIGDKVDIVFELIVNEWNGTKELQLKIIDLKKS
ncbi:MAG TPA: single-stranded-DNA-specific exonuclease RecJ [bacterium]|nr:single-stranded-DNA-specific exonuclease RecJ [bacterium]